MTAKDMDNSDSVVENTLRPSIEDVQAHSQDARALEWRYCYRDYIFDGSCGSFAWDGNRKVEPRLKH
jgi:hypothetical protein